MKKLFTLLVCIAAMATFAQAPQGFNYQATVRNSVGALIIKQIVAFKFSVKQTSASGTTVYSETQFVTPDDLGQVSLVIGTGAVITGTFATINWASGTYYLAIELNTGAGFVAMGTTQLLSVPYALNAANGITTAQADAITAQAATNTSLQAQIAVMQAQINSLLPLPILVIGTQTWTTKNLDVSTYSDGTVIPEVKYPDEWANLTTGAWCYYNNDSAYGTTYGKLYNWYAVAGIWNEASKTDASQRKKLAPTGYHIPSDTEWTTLTDYLGGESIAGGKMKEMGTTHWNTPNTDSTNSSGFTGLPGGSCAGNGIFINIGYYSHWWSSLEAAPTNALSRFLIYNNVNSYRYYGGKTAGFSVRCLKD